jgi:hypothetical protein
MVADSSRHWFNVGHPIDRDVLEAPLIPIEHADAATTLRPSFDFTWQAAGWPGSQYYDNNGQRTR